MAITRRHFLKCTGVTAAGAVLGPGLFGNPFVRQALADTIGDRYLVVLFLDGGNDGLNTVVPYDNGSGSLRSDYQAARRSSGAGGLRLATSDLEVPSLAFKDRFNTNAQLGFHPGLVGLRQLYDLGKVAVIQGCGYPEYSLSHEESRVIWQTGNPLGYGPYAGNGWVGRYLAANYTSTDISAVGISDSVPPEFRTSATGVLAVRRLREFGFPYDNDYGDDDAARRQAFFNLYTNASNPYIGSAGIATLESSESYPALHDLYQNDRATFDEAYEALDNGTARGFREIAKIIYGVTNSVPNINARHFRLANGGYDTHSDQGAADTEGQHYELLQEVGDAIKVFYDDIADMGAANKVCILVWSEFARRIPQNDNGTDHGSQGPMFVIGGLVNGEVYGRHPNINMSALDDDENTEYRQDAGGFRSTDFRDVYGTVLKHWLNMPHGTILSNVLPIDSGDPAFYWTAEDFDLGFLP